MIDVSKINALNIFTQYQTIARQFTAQGLRKNTTWPFVQLPSYEAQASAAAEVTAATFVIVTPIVQTDKVDQYETFVTNSREWIQEGLDYQGVDTSVSSLTLIPQIYPVLEDKTFDNMTLPFHLPVAQVSSVHLYSALVNGDTGMDADVEVAFSVMNTTRNAVMSGLRSTGGDSAQPASFLATPVFESYDDDAPVVAVVSGYLRWYRNFESLLPLGSEPLILVIRNCDDAISYEIEGPSAKFLGNGDSFHEEKYSHLERNGTFAPYASSSGCHFTLHIFPTASFEATYRTNSPATKTIAIVSCFVFTAILFVLFNLVVEYRQKKLESNANKNSALVSSLFPENVRERLVAEYEQKPKEVSSVFDPTMPINVALATRPPIADRFDCSSVFFADLVGCKCVTFLYALESESDQQSNSYQ